MEHTPARHDAPTDVHDKGLSSGSVGLLGSARC